VRVSSGNAKSKIENAKWVGVFAIIMLAMGVAMARAQQSGKVYRIGLLHSASEEVAEFTDAFRLGMRERGYVEGKSYILEIPAREPKTDQVSDLAAELIGLKVDIMLTLGFPAIRAAKDATSTIPIVMQTGSDPVKRGIVASLARPGGNITGVVTIGVALNAKRLELLAEAVPGVKRIAVLTTSRGVASREGGAVLGAVYKELEAVERALGLQLQILRAQDASEIDKAFAAMTKRQAGALLVMAHAQYVQNRERIIRQAATNRIPAIYFHSSQMRSGGLMAYGVNIAENSRRTAVYVDKILKGARPGDLPVEQPTKFELAINLKAAKQIGLTIPPNFLARADRVIR
jgi:putative ABC transport system substrate-binding protein